ncbi:hypothetical protein GCM10011607_28790 [Shewanella inventionis]|uniref:Uncharacterized protein n=1 Tax=Shewanella inventionis TaxID=1738770 RepID=A0ABQ1JH33_9GAMM|nr:hypothetical protein [Shewanella inventionis]GGB66378.1 hypothetical protein GCM10011607_28790 [Shewanella inventionis]
MIKLNDSFGLDQRIDNINKKMSDEHRRLGIISRALSMAELNLFKKVDSLITQSAEYKANVSRLKTKL